MDRSRNACSVQRPSHEPKCILVIQHKSYLHPDLVPGYLSVRDIHFVVLNPRALNVFKRVAGAGDTLLQCIFETGGRR